MELAATDLLDKDPDQVANRSVRTVLRQIQARSGFFYANRQVFVVAVIAFMSLSTAYPWVYVPGAGRVTAAAAPSWFSFLLTTLTVLWFAQVLPKRLAIINSELFLRQSRVIWVLIRMVGVLGLPNPTDAMVAAVRRYTPYREHRMLLPSRARHYTVQARLHGYSLDRLSTTVVLEREGVMTIRKRFLVLLLHGAHSETYGTIEMPAEPRQRPRVRLLGLYLAPVPEQLEALTRDLDEVFAERPRGPWSRLRQVPLQEWRHEVVVRTESSLDSGTTTYCEIRGESLPETFQETGDRAPATMAALVFELEARYGPASGPEPERSWSETIELPCRLLTIEAAAGTGSRVAVVARTVRATMAQSHVELADESGRLSREVIANRGTATIAYPLVGATYELSWDTVRRSTGER
jgi:hypothetical protein